MATSCPFRTGADEAMRSKALFSAPCRNGRGPVGRSPFGFDGVRRPGRTGHDERLSFWRLVSKGRGRIRKRTHSIARICRVAVMKSDDPLKTLARSSLWKASMTHELSPISCRAPTTAEVRANSLNTVCAMPCSRPGTPARWLLPKVNSAHPQESPRVAGSRRCIQVTPSRGRGVRRFDRRTWPLS